MPASIAVITPYKNETEKTVWRCIETVQAQSFAASLHIFICDGDEFPIDKNRLPESVQIMTLPKATNDTGATPRAIGTIYAHAHFCNAAAYLDVDNTWTSDHLACAIKAYQSGAHIVFSHRRICHYSTHEPIGVDTFDSGTDFVDTNCITLFDLAMNPGTQWWRIPKYAGERVAGVDRYLWRNLKKFAQAHQLTIARIDKATVNYNSRWLGHYQTLGIEPPKPAKQLIEKNGYFVAAWV